MMPVQSGRRIAVLGAVRSRAIELDQLRIITVCTERAFDGLPFLMYGFRQKAPQTSCQLNTG
jgi:hypothetical protein